MNNKIITFSFDDGTQFDKRLIDLFNKYHMKCTFNILSSKLYIVLHKKRAIANKGKKKRECSGVRLLL